MSAHQIYAASYAGVGTAEQGLDPGAAALLQLRGRSGIYFSLNSGGSTQTNYLPEDVPVGTRVIIYNAGSGTLTVEDESSNEILAQTTGHTRIYLMTPQGWAVSANYS